MQNLVIREDANNKISVSNLSRHRPNSVEEVMQLILEGNKIELVHQQSKCYI